MNKRKSLGYQMRYVCMMLACLLMVGCQEEEKWGTGATSGFRISLQDAAVGVETKSTPEELGEPLKTNFSIKVLKQSTGESETYEYKENLVIPASAGIYDITASYGKNSVLALDEPYYEGKAEDKEIKEDATEAVSVAIECTVANALTSVVYEDEDKFKELFSSYGVNVKVGGSNVTLNNSNAGKSAYYQAGSKPTFTFVGTLKGNGQEVEKQLTAEDNSALGEDATFAAAQHCILTLSLGTSEPGVNLTLSKVEVEEVTINETIPLEWLPAPKVSATGFDEATKTLDFYETNTPDAASIDFEVNEATGLQDLEFSLNFEDETFQELTGDYTLSTMSDEDKAKFADAGITLPLTGQTSPKIDFTSTFINQLRAKDEGAVVNTITIKKVTANNRPNKDESPLVYTINTHKPEFTVEVLDGNVWSKTFTAEEITVAEGKGNLETIKQNLVYQYSTDGNSWTDFSDQTTRTQAFAEHPDIKEYQVRAVYRGDLFSNNMDDLELEMPTQLPNSGMEEWSISSDNVGFLGFTYYTFYPYSSGESDVWWTTKNQRSQDGVKAGAISYKGSFSPCVSYSESEKHQGNRSALIYTSGHGGGYSSTSSVLYTKGAFAGSLFIGNYHWTGDSEEITQGHVFSVRPTALEFWYNYIPKKSDSFKAYIELRNGDEVIASGEFIPIASSSSSGWTKGTISLDDYIVPTKVATSIYVQFLSTTKTSFSESDFDKNKLITFPVMGDWNAHIGSMLYIDDLNLIYGR